MAVVLQATYAKKLGLPRYSSHQFTVSVQAELTDLSDVPGECGRLYALLQESVDKEIKHPGWLPEGEGGFQSHDHENGHTNGTNGSNGSWNCSQKQRGLILNLVAEHDLDRQGVDALARERFGKGVRELNKLEASGLIDELLETHSHVQVVGAPVRGNGNGMRQYRRPYAAGRGGQR